MAFDPSTVAESVPVYVREDSDGTATLVDTATNTAIQSGFLSVRVALQAALGLDALEGFVKAPVLRTDGEVDGVWHWLDATAVEDAPLGGVRIAEQAIWEMAASVNARSTPLPINGGGGPDGLGESVEHGDARDGGDHLANGWVHVGIPVVAKGGRLHVFWRAEILPELSPEVDRGRLAFGSVHFAYDKADRDDNMAAIGAQLVSHALTNAPAVTTLTAGSERRRAPGPLLTRAACSLWSRQMSITIDQLRELHATATDKTASAVARYTAARGFARATRGAAADVLQGVVDLLGLSAEQVAENDFAIADAVWVLIDAAKVEDIVEGAEPGEVEDSAETVEASAKARVEIVAIAKRGLVLGPLFAKRSEHGLEGEELDEFADAVLEFGRTVLDKPDAPPAEVVEELIAREDEIKAVIEEDEEPEEEEEEEGGEVEASAHKRLHRQRQTARGQRDTARTERDKALAMVERYETRDWLDKMCGERGLALSEAKREQYLKIALGSRETVEVVLDALNAPPSDNPMDAMASRAASVNTPAEAYDSCMDDAQTAVDDLEAREAKKQRRGTREVPRHVVRSYAQRLAAERFPEVVQS